MIEHFVFYLFIVVLIVLLILLGRRIKVAYPVLLVIAGLAVSFVPGVPRLRIEPELIFIIFLPPLLYEAAWSISWKELWRWRRIITNFAFLVVFLTALSVALVTERFIPGFTLALGFLLGGIVSPPDAVSAGAILSFVKVPRRVASILGGESLLNDASSLIIFQFALIAVATGEFVWYQAAGSFLWMVIGGVGTGLLVAWIFMLAHKKLPTDPNIDIVLSIVAPYLMYILAEEVHSSGVLAVVSGGLWLANHRHHFLSSSSRLRGVNVWESLCFVLNGLVFMLIGLDLPQIVSGLGDTSLTVAIGYGVLVTAVLILVRILSSYGALLVTLIARNFITVADPRNPGWKVPLVMGWSGMRGVVSLAAALSIPETLFDGSPFPQRDLILFVTFVAILLTLIMQGLTLPALIRKVNMADPDFIKSEAEIDAKILQQLSQIALQFLKNKYADEVKERPQLLQVFQMWEQKMYLEEKLFMKEQYRAAYLDVLDQQRQWLLEKNRAHELLDETIIRKYLKRIDLEEERLQMPE